MPYRAIRYFKASGEEYFAGDEVPEEVVAGVEDTLLGSKYITEEHTQAPSSAQMITASAPPAPASVMGREGADLDVVAEEIRSAEPATPDEEASVAQRAINESAAEENAANAGTEEESATSSDVNATSGAKEEAERLGIDLADVDGTGARGRITQDDVRRVANERESGDNE